MVQRFPDLHMIGQALRRKGGDRRRHRRPPFHAPQPGFADRVLHGGVPTDLHLDPEERMSPAAEHRARGLQCRRSIVRISDHAGPVQLRRRKVRERDEEPTHLEDLASLDHLGADALTLEARGSDPIGEVHPRMLPRG